MKIIEHTNEIELIDAGDFDPVKIFECGQCFRWNMGEDGSYIGVALGRAARVRREGDRVFISGSAADYKDVWHDYFDMNRDYASIRKSLSVDEYMTAATEFGAGIRILNQDRWEALCSFIISQCNNIPRIKKIVEALCDNFGGETEFEGKIYRTFPSAAEIARLTAEDLAPIRCGYRAPYIIDAARAVAEGEVNLEKLAAGDFDGALRALKTISGVGDKVANCVILFSLRMLDAFPEDVWIKKAIKEHYGAGFDVKIFGDYAGIAQQYMFYYQRSGK